MQDTPVMLVAGASGSIGSAVAREAARQGWDLVLQGRSADKLAALAAEIAGAVRVTAIALDMHGDGAAQNLVDQAAARFGRLDAVVDCVSTGPAGARLTGLFKDTDPAHYAAFYALSAAWFQRLAHAAWPHLAKRGGTLIAFVSDAGKFAAPRQTIVGAARAATIGFVRNLAVEAARERIRVHCISPSYVAGSEVAAKMGAERMVKAEQRAGLGLPNAGDIAPVTVFLCGAGAAKITGQVISINGGLNA